MRYYYKDYIFDDVDFLWRTRQKLFLKNVITIITITIIIVVCIVVQ
jgi:hypothetical protein